MDKKRFSRKQNPRTKNKTMSNTTDLSKVRILLDKDGYLILAGHPSIDDAHIRKEIRDCIKNEGTIKTISIEEYRKSNFKSIYQKSKI